MGRPKKEEGAAPQPDARIEGIYGLVKSLATNLKNIGMDQEKQGEAIETIAKTLESLINECSAKFTEYEKEIAELKERVAPLEIRKSTAPNINKVEGWEKEPEMRDGSHLRMNYEDKLQSMRNAAAILPPNYKDELGRHSAENIGKICGFIVTDEMYNDLYKGVA